MPLMVMLLTLLLEAVPSGAQPPRVLAVVSHSAKQYEDALEGFKEHFARSQTACSLEVSFIEGDPARAAAEVKRADTENFQLILTLGAVASVQAARAGVQTPIVAGLVLNADEEKGNGNIHWVFLDIPFDVQFRWLARILPDARNIGIMYDPGKNSEKMESAAGQAKEFGINLYTQKIERPSDIPEALGFLSKRVDAILGIPDPAVYTRQTTQHILLFSLRNRIPFIGLSEAWVKAGAFYSLDYDYQDIGLQCGELAEEILKGGKDSASRASFPRKVVFIVNLKTAAHMRIEIPDSVVRDAHKAFK